MSHMSAVATGPLLCRGNDIEIAGFIDDSPRYLMVSSTLWIIFGCSFYGAAVGLWRSPVLAGYVAFKLPALILFTTIGNALLNGLLAPLLGIPLTFRQSFLAILSSFAIASTILASLSPIALALSLNAPPPDSAKATQAHQVVLLFHTTAVGFAGVVSNVRLFGLLKHYSDTVQRARTVLFCWLAGNMLLGTQLSWIMRPFFGTPTSPVEFLRDNALEGNFFESVYKTVLGLLGG